MRGDGSGSGAWRRDEGGCTRAPPAVGRGNARIPWVIVAAVPVSGVRCVPHVGEGSRRSERAPGTRGASWATAETARAAAAVMGARRPDIMRSSPREKVNQDAGADAARSALKASDRHLGLEKVSKNFASSFFSLELYLVWG